ncbi:VPLPA-CTERM sorting domain-containing protein [Mangrovicoccus algicola]|uniref:VPLPA-CTERM sorting domain-containing protein n=1 Tax=Mangrovicoccus algicola TaxID=2771008 RepID=A0A8J7D127_9RHOB|nr:VPLPA-CTERM sorting domain-containing protein [Mangrovicoccus algicola]MBE3640273.1 VPLPA-CTERM sorting domain-containing protein [Mangrovicoccus algicola]
MTIRTTLAAAAIFVTAAMSSAIAATFSVTFTDFHLEAPSTPGSDIPAASSMDAFDATTEAGFPRVLGYLDTPFPAVTLTLDGLEFAPSGRSYSLSGGSLERAGFLFFGERNEGGAHWQETTAKLSFSAAQIAAIEASPAGTLLDLPVELALYSEFWDRSTWTRYAPDRAVSGYATARITVLTSDAVAAVPLPAGLPLLGAGLAGLGLLRRRRTA